MNSVEQKLDELTKSVKKLEGDNLKDTIDNYSNTNRNIYIFFMLLLLTIFSIATRTDDESILKDSLVVFPILNIQVPTYYFYIVAPLIIFIVHFSVLFNLYQHIKRLREWMEKGNRVEKSSWLRSYMFNHLLSYNDSCLMFHLLKFILWLTLFAIPLIVLVFLQYKFLPYHSYFVTNLNRVFILLDLIVLIYFYPKIRNKPTDNGLLKNIWFHFKHIFYVKNRCKLIKKDFCGFVEFISILINFILILTNFLILTFLFIFTFLLLFIPETNNEKFMDKKISDFIHRNLDLPEKVLVKEPPSPEILSALLANGKKEENIYIKYSKGLNLKGRDLRFANFRGIKLYKVDLRNAQLQGADLSYTQLHRAHLSYAQLHGAHLSYAQLKGAMLKEAILQGADLYYVQLQGADLYDTQFQGANLELTQFQGAHLFKTQLQGADLSYAQLQGSMLVETTLRGIYAEDINLTNSYLQDLDFNTTFNFDKFIVKNRAYLDKYSLERLQKAKERVNKNIDVYKIKKLFEINKYFKEKWNNYLKQLSCENKWIAKKYIYFSKDYIQTNCPQMQKTLEEEFDIEF